MTTWVAYRQGSQWVISARGEVTPLHWSVKSKAAVKRYVASRAEYYGIKIRLVFG